MTSIVVIPPARALRPAIFIGLVVLYLAIVLAAASGISGSTRPGVHPSPAPNRTPNACQLAQRTCP